MGTRFGRSPAMALLSMLPAAAPALSQARTMEPGASMARSP